MDNLEASKRSGLVIEAFCKLPGPCQVDTGGLYSVEATAVEVSLEPTDDAPTRPTQLVGRVTL